MKILTKQLLSTITIAAIAVFSPNSVFAQVKIGTNPTTIGTNNNFEVEGSTAGRKTSIDKTTGKITIADGTQGEGKVLTSDASGGASWSPIANPTQVNFFATFNGIQLFTSNDQNTKINFTDVSPNIGNGYDVTTDVFTAPVAGIYYFIGTAYSETELTGYGLGAVAPYRDIISIKVNNVAKLTHDNNYSQYTEDNGGGYDTSRMPGSTISIAYLVRLSVGDIVELFAYSTKQNPKFVGYSQTITAPQTTFEGFLIGQ